VLILSVSFLESKDVPLAPRNGAADRKAKPLCLFRMPEKAIRNEYLFGILIV